MKSCLFVLLLAILAISCSKSSSSQDTALTGQAVITQVKYACGPSCDAAAWTVQLNNQAIYEPTELPANFQVNDLPVTLVYQKTGLRSSPGQGSGEEKITILHIEKR